MPPALETASSSARDPLAEAEAEASYVARLLVSYMPLDQAFKLSQASLLYYQGCQPETKRRGCYIVPIIAARTERPAKKRVLAVTLEGLLSEDSK